MEDGNIAGGKEDMGIQINRNTKIRGVQIKAVSHVTKHLLRHIGKCLMPCLVLVDDIFLIEETQEKECVCLRAGMSGNLCIR